MKNKYLKELFIGSLWGVTYTSIVLILSLIILYNLSYEQISEILVLGATD